MHRCSIMQHGSCQWRQMSIQVLQHVLVTAFGLGLHLSPSCHSAATSCPCICPTLTCCCCRAVVVLCACSNVSFDAAAGRLSFSSRHLGCLALLHDTSAHLPYSSWTTRPTGGLGGSTAVIDLQVSAASCDCCACSDLLLNVLQTLAACEYVQSHTAMQVGLVAVTQVRK